MRYRKLSADDDYTFGASQLNFWRDVPEAVGQAAKTRLLLWLGEWFLNIEEGTPYMIGVLGKKTKTEADITLQERILKTQGMRSIDTYESAVDQETDRIMEVSTTLNTIYGPTAIEVGNYANY